MAAELLDLATVPTITLAGLTDQQRRAYIIADNKLALNAGWEPELLRLELEILSDESFDLELLGFNAEELESLFDATPLGDAEPEQGDTDPSLRVVQFVLRASDFDSFIDQIETIIEAEPQLTDYPSKHGGVIKRAVSYLHERYDV